MAGNPLEEVSGSPIVVAASNQTRTSGGPPSSIQLEIRRYRENRSLPATCSRPPDSDTNSFSGWPLGGQTDDDAVDRRLQSRPPTRPGRDLGAIAFQRRILPGWRRWERRGADATLLGGFSCERPLEPHSSRIGSRLAQESNFPEGAKEPRRRAWFQRLRGKSEAWPGNSTAHPEPRASRTGFSSTSSQERRNGARLAYVNRDGSRVGSVAPKRFWRVFRHVNVQFRTPKAGPAPATDSPPSARESPEATTRGPVQLPAGVGGRWCAAPLAGASPSKGRDRPDRRLSVLLDGRQGRRDQHW